MAEDFVRELTRIALEAVAAGAAVHRTGARRTAAVAQAGTPADVDRDSERRIVAIIQERRPHDAIVGEEERTREGTTDVRWLIDPLDGSANYAAGYPAYAVSVGVEVRGRPSVGVVEDTVSGTVYAGSIVRPAHADDREIRVRAARPLQRSTFATGFAPDREHRARQGRVLAAVLPSIADIRRSGSPALDLCRVAAGQLDGYFEIGLAPWDYAAGWTIVESAGGVVDVIDCHPWLGPLVVAGPVTTVDRVKRLLARAGVPGIT